MCAALRYDTFAQHGFFDFLALFQLFGRRSTERVCLAFPVLVPGRASSPVMLAHGYLADGASLSSWEAGAFTAEAAVLGASQSGLIGIHGDLNKVPKSCLEVLKV